MDKALHYAAKNILETGHNSKPVLTHSFRVADLLYQLDYEEDIVIAAILHDLIEDTCVTYDDIKNHFNERVADIVLAVSFDPNIDDYIDQTKAMFTNCINYGIEAVIVKCSDLIQNIDFVVFVDDIEKRNTLLKKYEIFLDMTKDIISTTKIYEILKNKYNLLTNKNDVVDNYIVINNVLSADDFLYLWNSVWDEPPTYEQVKLALENTIDRVSIYDGDKLIGMARMIGDKGMEYYIKDVVVIPEYQGKGIGKMLINELLKYVNDNGIKGTDIYVELCAEPEVIPFYQKCGFDSNDAQRLKLWHKVK